MEKELPRIDLPEDWVAGELTSEDLGLLSLYADYPCRLKAGIFVYCAQGTVDATIDLTRRQVGSGNFITLLPGTIIQIHSVQGDPLIYFNGFSSNFIKEDPLGGILMNIHYTIKERPVHKLEEDSLPLLKGYFEVMVKTFLSYHNRLSKDFVRHIFQGILLMLENVYKKKGENSRVLTKSELIVKNFNHLLMQHYTRQRNVAWYAQQLGITPAHLSTIVKQTTGKTCLDLIASIVIMDAKAQLKSTNLSIHDIAYSLNFTNMSFFGKYFKRIVGMGPLEYRNS